MKLIKHTDVRLANNVFMLSQAGISWYKRHRGERFQQQPIDRLLADDYLADLRLALVELRGTSSVDIILEREKCDIQQSEKFFGAGWAANQDGATVEVLINCLFAAHALTISADSNMVSDIAKILRDQDIEFGRVFYACPSMEFRYSVFSQLCNIYTSSDVLNSILVNYCANLPRFGEQDYRDESTQMLNFLDVVPTVQSRPVDATVHSQRAQLPNSLSKSIKYDESPQIEKTNQNSVTLCVLLDNTVETAMAAGVYLANGVRPEPVVMEVGLWRKKLKSVFQKFTPVMNVFEFLHLPLSDQDLKDLSIFLSSVKSASSAGPLVFVIGEEMLNQTVADEMVAALEVLSPYDMYIFGHSGQLLEKKLPNLVQFVEKSTNCIIKVADCDAALAMLKSTIKNIKIDLFNISPTVKQKLLLAEKNNTLRSKLIEVRKSVFPKETVPIVNHESLESETYRLRLG